MNLRLFAAAVVAPLALSAATEYTFISSDGAVENEARAAQRFAPCSTFKIPNSLIALETGVVTDAAFPLQYDPKRDGEQHGAWARDHDLRSAIRNSAVWYYRELARRIGSERMRVWVTRFGYGNQATTPDLDRFWLGQDLRISAKEQVDFLRRFYFGQLGVSPRTTAVVKDILLLETGPGYQWFGKTGACQAPDHGWIGWHVGYVERNGSVVFYALNTGGASFAELIANRSRLVREKLASAGLIAREAPPSYAQMEARITSAVRAFPGVVSLFAKNLDTGAVFELRADQRVRTASTIKLPILAAVFSAVAQGNAQWDDKLTMRSEDKVSGSGVIREFADGTQLTIRDLVHMMIVVSDNTATNLLLDRFSADFVNAEMDKLGLKHTRSLRKILGDGSNLKPFASGHSREGLQEGYQRFGIGVSTPREMVSLLEKLERGEVVDAGASRDMLAILERQQYKDGLGRRQPDEAVASKSGALDRLRGDVGLVRSTGGRIAIAVTVDDMKRTDYSPENAGNVLISELTGMLLDGLSAPVSDLGEQERTVELKSAMDHVQGIYVDGDRVWVSWVDRKAKTGHLGEFDIASGRQLRSVEIQNGEQYHPGGIAGDTQSIWVPVAEYRRNSTATVQRRNRRTLALESEFAVPDHIGCIAVSPDRIYGGNWDSRQIYVWSHDGRLISKLDNPSRTRYQDLKFRSGTLIGSGLRSGEGAIDFLDPDGYRLQRRIRTGKTSRGVVLTNEGMAVADGRLYLLPEDSPSRLMIYRLSQ